MSNDHHYKSAAQFRQERDVARSEADGLREQGLRLMGENIALAMERDEARAEAERLRKAIVAKGGSEHAPTQWAYDQACGALHAKTATLDAANALLREVRTFFGTGDADVDLVTRIDEHLDAEAGGEV